MSVVSTNHRLRLPDQVSVNFGPPDLLARSFLTLDRLVRNQGIYLSINHDMRELLRVNAANQQHWYPLPPMFDASLGGIDEENAFWICGVNDAGEVVLSHACRLYGWSRTCMTDELESMRFFYPDPDSQRGPDEACVVDTEVARGISGRVCYSGALWVRPDYRGRGMASIMPRLTRAYALTQWYPDYTWSLGKLSLIASGMAKTYGWRNVDIGVRWLGSREGGAELQFAIGWLDREAIVDDLEGYARLIGDPVSVLRV